ncbi:hypothetical protein [Mycolicibacterium sp.]|nr:hypothetical protein [Mycolicibacterium sp.]MBJ7337844.1 hypothetical protein [Mycolicibacterium sp.]
MPSISSLVVRVFDDPRTTRRGARRDDEGNRTRVASKGRVPWRRGSGQRG